MHIDWKILLTALGLAFILEGLPYFLAAEKMPSVLRALSERKPAELRTLGLTAMPEVVTENVTIDYAAPEGFKHPAARSDFWKFAPSLVGKALPADVSATGLKPDGTFTAGDKLFTAAGIPVTPYPEKGGVNPYPVFTVTAKDTKTGAELAMVR